MPPPLPAPPPLRPPRFDPYNSSSTGHQRAENRLASSTAWRDSRTRKLRSQFADASGAGGQERLYDTVGAGSEFFGQDGRKTNGGWEDGAEGRRREMGVRRIKGWLVVGEAGKKNSSSSSNADKAVGDSLEKKEGRVPAREVSNSTSAAAAAAADVPANSPSPPPPPPSSSLFHGCVFYLNGSTSPHTTGISDHRLRALLTQHGGALALGLARRKVTHVILGTPASDSSGKGAGGGLAAGKVQRELQRRMGGAGGVKYVGVEWVLECVRVGRRVGEGRLGRVGGGLRGARERELEEMFGGKGGG